MAEAVRYVEKWKPQNLHLEPNSWIHMPAAIRLAQVQQQYDRDFAIVDLVVFISVECTSSKSDGQGQEYEAGGVQQLLWNRTSIPCEQLCSEGQTPALHQATDDDASSRRCAQGIGEVTDIRKKVRAKQHSASDVMNMVDNLHDEEETEGVYIDDVNGGELSKEKNRRSPHV